MSDARHLDLLSCGRFAVPQGSVTTCLVVCTDVPQRSVTACLVVCMDGSPGSRILPVLAHSLDVSEHTPLVSPPRPPAKARGAITGPESPHLFRKLHLVIGHRDHQLFSLT